MAGRQTGFRDVERRLRQIPDRGDPLEKLAATVDLEVSRAEPVAAQGPRDRSKGGGPPFDPVLKLRMLVLRAMHGLPLAQTELLVADRPSWMRSCGLGPGDAVPDANTLRDSREALIAAGYLPMAGQIVGAKLVAAPRQRNTEAGKARIEAGETAATGSSAGPGSPTRRSMTARANAKRSAARAHVERPFAHQKGPMRLVIRTIGIARAAATVMLANMACNMRRWCWLDGRSLPV